jgi:hypothetical protein
MRIDENVSGTPGHRSPAVSERHPLRRSRGRRLPRRSLLASCILALIAVAPRSEAGVIYVDDLRDGLGGDGTAVSPWRTVQGAIDAAHDGDTIMILPGTYETEAVPFVEELCGNCEEHRTPVEATRGFLVRGKSLNITGSGPSETTLVTNAGYGVLFEDSAWSTISDLTITGGRRDPDGMATDAAVVARRSAVIVRNTCIRDNDDMREDVVVGIGGVIGREGAGLFVVGNTIVNNGWDGVALYRGATAFIADNVIAGGRGAGIGITWDAVAVVLRNRVSGYWKGIGSFGSSRAVVRNNEIFDNLGWGIVATGTSSMEASNNVVARNGNCGIALWSEDASLTLVNNIVTENGWRDEWVCARVGVWMNGLERNLDARHNDVWGNVEGDYRDMEPLSGADGNLSLEPLFADSLDFRLRPGSPCIDTGEPSRSDPDGTPSDMGSWGGPGAAGVKTAGSAFSKGSFGGEEQ